MFKSASLFQGVHCPDLGECQRPNCLFSHTEQPSPRLHIPRYEPNVTSPPASAPTPASSSQAIQPVVPAKRSIPAHSGSKTPVEPPRKLQKLSAITARPTVKQKPSGEPTLNVSAATSFVPIPVRQTMLKTLYDHFKMLYAGVKNINPELAAEHSLRQEEEVYKESTKFTYRNAIISTVAKIKKREPPDSPTHDSIGTEKEIAERKAQRKSLTNLTLTKDYLTPLVLSNEQLVEWGFFTEVPACEGGVEPHIEGKTAKCERCAQPCQVKRQAEAEECIYHWGRPYTRNINGERLRIYSCCSRPSDAEGCVRGPHVFYESELATLHARHAFSTSKEPGSQTRSALDVAALDCEMIYTTGGMRLARVSVLDGSGTEVLDEFIRMDDGVEVIDYNTRFSGINSENYAKAVLTLDSVRKSLDVLIDKETILIGHALDNDLKALRIIHNRCVDTSVNLFPHKAGKPYRRSLRDLVKEHLGQIIQAGGGSVGHSSVEDTLGTLNLVRWYILNKGAKQSHG